MSTTTRLRVLACAGAALLASTGLAQDRRAVRPIDGDWVGEIQAPDNPDPIEVELRLQLRDRSLLRGSMAVAQDHSPIVGSYATDTGLVRFDADFDDDEILRVELRRGSEDSLEGMARLGEMVAPLSFRRTAAPLRFFHDLGFELPTEMPMAVDVGRLDADTSREVVAAARAEIARANAVGVSMAIIVDGAVVDVRSFGWEDVARRVSATGDTMYRWASIAKPMTAVAALQLVELGDLDLDRDVREYVPEFPEKRFAISTRELLGHQGGIVHYSNGEVIRTEREYDLEHPWEDRILSLDWFKESPLIAEPGSRYSYTSHGYILVGAIVERAGGAKYAEQVRARIAEPLGMSTLQPDYPWVEIPHRAVGYRGLRNGLGTLDEDLDVSWKLPAGGWISTIGDLARFGAGLLRGDLLEPETAAEMNRSRVPLDGRDPFYGYGIGVGQFDGHRALSHSGQQSKADTFLLLCPDEGLGAVVMSNSSNFGARRLAQRLVRVLLRRK